MNKQILIGKESRDKVIKGVNIMADAVSVTLGPNGKNVLISESVVIDYGTRSLPIKVTKDGVSVAEKVHLTDTIENIGASMLREASQKTMAQCGDGTTSSIVLARAFVNEGMKAVQTGANPMELKKNIDAAVKYVVDEIKRLSIPVGDDVEKIRQIATISANGDSSIGDLIAQAFKEIGRDGNIDIEEAKSVNTEIKMMDGFEFDKGYISPYFITNRAKNICELENPNILIFEKSITVMKTFYPILEKSIGTGRALLIICEDCDGEALSTLIMNHVNKTMPPVCVVRYPTFGTSKVEMMEDIASVTGAAYLTDSKGIGLERATIEHLGQAKKVVISKDSTIIVGGKKDKDAHENLLNELKMNLVDAKGDDEKESIQRRIARLIGGIAVIYVGAATETEMKERKDRVDDAVRATKAAIAEGYIVGGGLAFLQAIRNVTSAMFNENKAGFEILFPVLESPLRQICANAGKDPKDILRQISDSENGIGYNARNDEMVDMLEAGIIDPAKVLRCSIQNAASVATMILTSECVIADVLN